MILHCQASAALQQQRCGFLIAFGIIVTSLFLPAAAQPLRAGAPNVAVLSGQETPELELAPAQTLTDNNILSTENWEIIKNAMLLTKTADSLGIGFDLAVDENHSIVNIDKLREEDKPGSSFEDLEAWYDGEDDVSVFGSKGGLCYVAFRSTTMALSDWGDNFDLRSQNMKGQCDVPFGFYKGWENSYSDSLKQKLMSCANDKCASTNGQDCIVITGFSQGGAISGVATVALSHMKPKLTVVFGSVRSLQKSCKDFVDLDRYISFCNTKGLGVGVGIMSDIACSQDLLLTLRDSGEWDSFADFGHYFELPPSDDSLGILYFGRLEGDKLHRQSLIDQSPEPHLFFGYGSYGKKIEHLADHQDTVTTDGFKNGQPCNKDYMCESERCTLGTCMAKQKDGEICEKDNHCESGKCASGSTFMCRPLLDVGDWCVNSGDCKPGLKCVWRWSLRNPGNKCYPSAYFAATGAYDGKVQIVSRAKALSNRVSYFSF